MLRVQRPLFSKSHESDTRIPDVNPYGGRSFNFGDGASSKVTSLSRLPVRNDALGDFWIHVHLFSDQPKPTPLMLGMEFLKEHRCIVNYGEDLIQFPMQSDCWWTLSVCRVVVCTPCNFAVSIGSFRRKHNDKLPPQRTTVWSFQKVTCIH